MKPVEILRERIPLWAIECALGEINRQFLHGQDGAEFQRAIREANWFPWIREAVEITRIPGYFPEALRAGVPCEPQILLQFPVVGTVPPIGPHVDEEPPWADGRKYARIVGVPLTRSKLRDGCLHYWDPEKPNAPPEPVEAYPGDLVVIRPDVPHASGVNRSGAIRYVLYFRYLEP